MLLNMDVYKLQGFAIGFILHGMIGYRPQQS